MILIRNAKILTMAGPEINDGYISSVNGKIKYVGEVGAEALKVFDGNNEYQQIDAKGGYVLPGLIDAHCHIGLWEDGAGFEGEDGNESTDPITPHLRAIDGVYHMDRCFIEAREAGITTVVTGPGSANVIGGQFAALKTIGRYVDEMIIKEPVAIKAAFGENPKTVYYEKRQTPITRMATAALLREALEKTLEYKMQLADYEKNPEEKDKPDYDMKLQSLLKLINKEIHLKAHAHRADDILTAIRIAEEFNLDYTIEHCTEGYLIKDILKEKNVRVILGPLLLDRSKPELRNLDVKAPGILANAGVQVAIMTDHPCVPIHYLLLSAAMAHKAGMKEMDALRAVTINSAKFCGIDSRVGSLETGKDADIVIFDRPPLDFNAKVNYTIIDGKVIYSNV